MNIRQKIHSFLDAVGVGYVPEKHCIPSYGFFEEKPTKKQPENSQEKQPENSRKIRPGYRADIDEEKLGIVDSVWVSDQYINVSLTPGELQKLHASKLNIKIAEVVKREKLQGRLSNRDIVSKHHSPGARDGFSKGNVDKIAKIVAPSTDRG